MGPFCVLAGQLFILVSHMLSRLMLSFNVRRADVRNDRSIRFISLISTVAVVVVGAVPGLQISHLHLVDEFISQYALPLELQQFAMILISEALTVKNDCKHRETVYTGWHQLWKP